MAGKWFVQLMDAEIGPLSDGQLRTLAHEHRVKQNDLVRQGESGKWYQADRIRGLFANSAPSPVGFASLPIESELASDSIPESRSALSEGFTSNIPAPSLIDANDDEVPTQRSTSYAIETDSRGTRLLRIVGWIFSIFLILRSLLLLLPIGPTALLPLVLGILLLPPIWTKLFMWLRLRAERTVLATLLVLLFGGTENRPRVISGSLWILIAGTVSVGTLALTSSNPDFQFTSQVRFPSLRGETRVAISQKAYDRMMDLALAKDYAGLEALRLAGVAFMLPEDTEIRVINLGIFTTEIKIESGGYAGKYVIVATDHINK